MTSIRIPVVIVLTVLWTVLWGEFSPLVVVGGLLVSVLITWFFPFPPVDVHSAIRPWHVIVLVSVFLKDLTIASFQVGWLAVRPKAPPGSALIEMHLSTGNELLQTLTAELIALVPGSLPIELDSSGRRMWIHVFRVDTPEDVAEARIAAKVQEQRVIDAFGSQQERDHCRLALEELAP